MKRIPKDCVWVVTGVSKLTGEREVFSNPHNREDAEKMLQKAIATDDSERAFTDPMIELYENYKKANESK